MNQEIAMKNIEHIYKELEEVKKYLILQFAGKQIMGKKAWDKIVSAGQKTKWDSVSAVQEIRKQRRI